MKIKKSPLKSKFQKHILGNLASIFTLTYTIFSIFLHPGQSAKGTHTFYVCTPPPPLHTFIVSTRSSIMIHALRPKFICRMCLAAAKSSSQYWYIELYIYHNGPDQPNFVHFWSRQSDNDLVLLQLFAHLIGPDHLLLIINIIKYLVKLYNFTD